METVEIEREDRLKITEIVNNYKQIHTNLEMVLKKLELLTEEKDEMLNELINLRKKENEFSEYFKNKYGEGSLDLETGTYKIK